MDNRVLEFVFIMPNVVFYCMEMRFVVCKDLYMLVADDIGCVEIEIIIAVLTASFGFIGSDFYFGKVSDYITILKDYPIVSDLRVNVALTCIFLPL